MNPHFTKLFVDVLHHLATDPQIVGRLLDKLGLSLPNIPMKTLGGHVFWKTVASVRGWRVQKNRIFGNCRLLDPNNVRRAWGGESAMLRAFQSLKEELQRGKRPG